MGVEPNKHPDSPEHPVENESEKPQRCSRNPFTCDQALKLLDNMGEGFVAIGPDLKFFYVNEPAARMVNRCPEDLLGKTLPEVARHFPEVGNDAMEYARRVLNGESLRFTKRLENPDGDLRVFQLRFTPIKDDENKVVGAGLIVADITEQVLTDQAHRVGEQRLQAVLEHLPIGIWFTDANGTIVYGNPAGKRIWAGARFISPDEFHEYKAWWVETGEPVVPEDWAVVRAVRDGETSLNELLRIECFDGSRKVILNSAVPMRDDHGRIIGAAILNEDITERRKNEQTLIKMRDELEHRVRERTRELQVRADQLSRLASQLTLVEQRERRRLAQILHDNLQQLLAAAKFRLEQFQQHTGETERTVIDQITELIRESMVASRTITADLFPPILHEGGLEAGLEWLARWKKKKHGLDVELDLEPCEVDLPEALKILLFQSVRELLLNTCKHSGVTAARVKLRFRHDGHLVLNVSDDGRGFDPLSLPSGTERLDGGFGLFNIRERLDMLGGNMDVDSAPQQGTRFTLTVPAVGKGRAACKAEAAVISDSIDGSIQAEDLLFDPAEKGSTIRVLLADDHEVMRQGLSMLLSNKTDVEIVGEAADGKEAVDMARRLLPDVILMDYSMPELDGLEATRKIHAELPNIRIIGLSMYDSADRGAAMLKAGAVAYINKSGKADILLKTIRNEA